MKRCLFGPAPATFTAGDLAPSEALLFDFDGKQALTLPPDADWNSVAARFPTGWEPDFLLVSLSYTSIPYRLFDCPVPIIGLAPDWNLLWSCYRHVLPRVDVALTDSAGVEQFARAGLGTVRPANLFGLEASMLSGLGSGLQRVSTINYDADDNVTSRIDPLGFVTTMGYDPLNRRISVTNPDGGIATTGFDANDNVVTVTDQLGHASTSSYDVLNRKVTITDALGGVVTLNYDANNNLINLTDPVANQTQWQHDALNRRVLEINPLYNTSTMAYDAVDRVTSTTDKNGQLINFSYDLLNRESGETWIVGTIAQNLLTFTYDPNNNMLTAANNTGTITRTYDSLDRLSTNKDSFGTLVTNSYDAANNRTVIQDSFGGLVTNTFDALNRMATMAYTGQSTALRQDFAYSVRDQVTGQFRFSNLAGTSTVGYSTFSYDPVGRLTNLQHLNGSGSNIANFTNAYDLASRITAETLNGGTPTTYSYDITNQLTDDTLVTYSYDLNGNRETTGTFTYSTAGANQLASDGIWDYYYDKNGNLIQKVNISTGEVFAFGYDNRNRMVGVTDTTSAGLQMQATYSYDALGQRIAKDVWTGGVATITQMAYDDGRQIWVDMNGSSALQTQYLRADNWLELPARVANGGTVAWLLADRIGSVRNVVDSTGAAIDTITYDGFGNATQSNATNGGVYLWVGYRYDSETRLFRPDSTWSRPYAPAIGRWTSEDPIGFWANDPNLWRYVRNSTVNFADPTGLQGFSGGISTFDQSEGIASLLNNDITGQVFTSNGILRWRLRAGSSTLSKGAFFRAWFIPNNQAKAQQIGFIQIVKDSLDGKPYEPQIFNTKENYAVDILPGANNPTYQLAYNSKTKLWSVIRGTKARNAVGGVEALTPPIKMGRARDIIAMMEDQVGSAQGGTGKGVAERLFETCAVDLCTGQVFACLKWGFQIGPMPDSNAVLIGGTLTDVSTKPSQQWLDAVQQFKIITTLQNLFNVIFAARLILRC